MVNLHEHKLENFPVLLFRETLDDHEASLRQRDLGHQLELVRA